ncbi:sulfotransferase family protein [Pseudodesulfovibrio pelocollis]|uniref:sulfotransferase family protein n=1 Tax=Pseudodesulfovibrio pelocollis TaxID=3051432 RepID=UPI00255B2B07|nr:sulfotransferase [Pseudodesulfovibrio sp. SB368]
MNPNTLQTVFLSGMFRSGTTLTGRLLHAHPRIALASDGLFPFFKFLRNAIASRHGADIPEGFESPLADYAFGRQADVFRAVQQADLHLPLKEADRAELLARIATWCAEHPQYSPLLAPRAGSAGGATYAELLEELLTLIREEYGDRATGIVGFKEVWATEFVPALARTFPEMRFVCLVRDPRAVFASKKFRMAQYPPVFMARQWRKIAALAYWYGHDPALSGRVLTLRFEDVITEPAAVSRKMCDFLDIEWHPAMTDLSSFVNGLNLPWFQNSAFGRGGTAFDTSTLGRWQSSLSEGEIALVDYLCAPEMGLFGYEPVHGPDADATRRMLDDPPVVPRESLAMWIRRFEPYTLEDTRLELSMEGNRHGALRAGLNARDARHFFLHDDIHAFLLVQKTSGREEAHATDCA